jgi:hypothetical protein
MKTRTQRIRNLVGLGFTVTALWVIGGRLIAADAAADKAAMTAFMRAKLVYTQNVTEGMTLEDYFLVRRSAVKLRDMTRSNIWTKVDQPDYEGLTKEFQQSCDSLYQAAVDENLVEVTKAYTKVLKNCVDCHRDLRAKHGLETK